MNENENDYTDNYNLGNLSGFKTPLRKIQPFLIHSPSFQAMGSGGKVQFEDQFIGSGDRFKISGMSKAKS